MKTMDQGQRLQMVSTATVRLKPDATNGFETISRD
jgi:hypothetical protein